MTYLGIPLSLVKLIIQQQGGDDLLAWEHPFLPGTIIQPVGKRGKTVDLTGWENGLYLWGSVDKQQGGPWVKKVEAAVSQALSRRKLTSPAFQNVTPRQAMQAYKEWVIYCCSARLLLVPITLHPP